jgi:hypothetical protein
MYYRLINSYLVGDLDVAPDRIQHIFFINCVNSSSIHTFTPSKGKK